MPLARSLRNSTQPLYTRAIEELHDLLDQGGYKPGDPLPPESELALQLGISRSTLREAMGHLEAHGLVIRRQGLGTFVGAPVMGGFRGGIEQLEPFHSVATRAGLNAKRVERDVTSVPASADLAEMLDLPVGVELSRVQVVEAVNDRRMAYLDSYLRQEPGELDVLREASESVIDYLVGHRAPALSHARSDFQALNASEAVAAKLHVPPGQAVLHLRDVYYAADGVSMGVSLNYFLTEGFRFHVIRRVPKPTRAVRRGQE
jgi:GntR family transcriptional regulator